MDREQIRRQQEQDAERRRKLAIQMRLEKEKRERERERRLRLAEEDQRERNRRLIARLKAEQQNQNQPPKPEQNRAQPPKPAPRPPAAEMTAEEQNREFARINGFRANPLPLSESNIFRFYEPSRVLNPDRERARQQWANAAYQRQMGFLPLDRQLDQQLFLRQAILEGNNPINFLNWADPASRFGRQVFQGAQGFTQPLVTDPKVFNPSSLASSTFTNNNGGSLLANLPNLTNPRPFTQQLVQGAGQFAPQPQPTPWTNQSSTQFSQQVFRGATQPLGTSGFTPQGLATAAIGGTQTLAAPNTRQALTQQIVQNCRGGFCPPGIGQQFGLPPTGLNANLPQGTPRPNGSQPLQPETPAPNPTLLAAANPTVVSDVGLGLIPPVDTPQTVLPLTSGMQVNTLPLDPAPGATALGTNLLLAGRPGRPQSPPRPNIQAPAQFLETEFPNPLTELGKLIGGGIMTGFGAIGAGISGLFRQPAGSPYPTPMPGPTRAPAPTQPRENPPTNTNQPPKEQPQPQPENDPNQNRNRRRRPVRPPTTQEQPQPDPQKQKKKKKELACPDPALVARTAGRAGMQALLAADLRGYRAQIGVPTTNTVAVARSNTGIPALDCLLFTGASREVRREAGLPPLEQALEPKDREIKAPTNDPQFSRHAEEEIVNRFNNQVRNLKIPRGQITGTLYIRQSNPGGVCGHCLGGVGNSDLDIKSSGVLIQLSRMYPNLDIRVDTDKPGSGRANVRHNFTLRNGRYIAIQ